MSFKIIFFLLHSPLLFMYRICSSDNTLCSHKPDNKKGFQKPEHKPGHPYCIPINHLFPERTCFKPSSGHLAKIAPTKQTKNNTRWKYKAQSNPIFITVSMCLKYSLLTGLLEKNGEQEAASETFHSLRSRSETFSLKVISS